MKDNMKKSNLKEDTTTETNLKKFSSYSVYVRVSKMTIPQGFVNIDDGGIGGSDCTCFLYKR